MNLIRLQFSRTCTSEFRIRKRHLPEVGISARGHSSIVSLTNRDSTFVEVSLRYNGDLCFSRRNRAGAIESVYSYTTHSKAVPEYVR